jgi:predicted HAD superfamily Cof-like phosphohydrolase
MKFSLSFSRHIQGTRQVIHHLDLTSPKLIGMQDGSVWSLAFDAEAKWPNLKLVEPADIDRTGNLFTCVQQFHRKFGLEPIGKDLPEDVSDYRLGFLQEELDELAKGYKENDREQVLDALIDLVYVALGTADLHGFDFNAGFARVHAANLRKERASSADASKRSHALDVIKPPGWAAPELRDLVL